MFELLNTFWGGAVSFASGSLAIYGAVQIFSRKPKRVLYDFRSWAPTKSKLPHDFEVRYKLAERDFGTIHITECIIKNETGAPITDSSFLHLPKIVAGAKNTVCRVRRLDGLEDSRVEFRLTEDSSGIELCSIMIPIDSTLTFEIVSEEPIEKKVYCAHNDAKVEARNYGKYWRSRTMYSIVTFSLLGIIWLTLVVAPFFKISNPLQPLYEMHTAYFPAFVSALLVFLEVWSFLLLAVFVQRKIMNASDAERRFTELKANG